MEDSHSTQPGDIGEILRRLAAYEDTGLNPEEVTTRPFGCVFYCNRRCNLDWDWCTEGPGCPKELDQKAAMHILELSQAEKEGRILVLPSAPEINTLRAIVTAINALDFYPAADPYTVFHYKQILCDLRDDLRDALTFEKRLTEKLNPAEDALNERAQAHEEVVT